MFIKITVYTANRLVEFFDDLASEAMWRDYYLTEIRNHLIQGFTIRRTS